MGHHFISVSALLIVAVAGIIGETDIAIVGMAVLLLGTTIDKK